MAGFIIFFFLLSGDFIDSGIIREIDVDDIFVFLGINYKKEDYNERKILAVLNSVDPTAKILTSNTVFTLITEKPYLKFKKIEDEIMYMKIEKISAGFADLFVNTLTANISQEGEICIIDLRKASGDAYEDIDIIAGVLNTNIEECLYRLVDAYTNTIEQHYAIFSKPPLKKRINFVVITDKHTTDAATLFSILLKRFTHCIIIGEKPAEMLRKRIFKIAPDRFIYVTVGRILVNSKEYSCVLESDIKPDIEVGYYSQNIDKEEMFDNLIIKAIDIAISMKVLNSRFGLTQ